MQFIGAVDHVYQNSIEEAWHKKGDMFSKPHTAEPQHELLDTGALTTESGKQGRHLVRGEDPYARVNLHCPSHVDVS